MIKKIISVFILILIVLPINEVYATDEIISSQMETLNISQIIKDGEKYTKEAFPEVDLNELLNSAITGKVNNNNIFKSILSLFSKEIVSTITILRKYFNYNCNS